MRKRSKYRPKGVLQNPLGYVLEGFTPVTQHDSFAIDLRTKNHWALAELTQGRATRPDLDVLINALNMTEALCRLGLGDDYEAVIKAGLQALRSVGGRGLATGRFVLKSDEMNALNQAMELHDAQLDIATIRDIEKAIRLVQTEFRLKKATPIKAIS